MLKSLMPLLLAAAAGPTTINGWQFQQFDSVCVGQYGPDQTGTSLTFVTKAEVPDALLVQLSNPAWAMGGQQTREITLSFHSSVRVDQGRILPPVPAPQSMSFTAKAEETKKGSGRLLLTMMLNRKLLAEFGRLGMNGVHIYFTYQDRNLSSYYLIKPFVAQNLDKCRDPFRADGK